MIRRTARRVRRDLGRDLARHGLDLPHRRSDLDARRRQDRRQRHARRRCCASRLPPLREFVEMSGLVPTPGQAGRGMRRSWASVTVGALVLIVGRDQLLPRSARPTSTTVGNEGYTVWALFHDASGLFEKSRVQTAGISVGQIEKRELDPKTRRKARRSPSACCPASSSTRTPSSPRSRRRCWASTTWRSIRARRVGDGQRAAAAADAPAQGRRRDQERPSSRPRWAT